MRFRAFLLMVLLMTLVVGLSGCADLDRGIVEVPIAVLMEETFTIRYSFKSFELTTVTVSRIDWECWHDGDLYGEGWVDPGFRGWKTGTVPPFREVVIYSITTIATDVGSWEHRVVFHTSEGDFPAKDSWVVLPFIPPSLSPVP